MGRLVSWTASWPVNCAAAWVAVVAARRCPPRGLHQHGGSWPNPGGGARLAAAVAVVAVAVAMMLVVVVVVVVVVVGQGLQP